MKNLLFFLAIACTAIACNNQPTAETQAEPTVDVSKYPEALQKIFEKHGSLTAWKALKAMSYEIVDTTAGNELQMIDLHDRREVIKSPKFQTGYDGKEFWVKADTSYKGNPIFYHNLIENKWEISL